MKKDEQRLTQQALEEKRAELLDTETRLRETEEKYFSSASSIKDKVSDDLRVRWAQVLIFKDVSQISTFPFNIDGMVSVPLFQFL